MKHNNWFWGVFFVLAAVFVIVSQVTSFAHIGFWSILAVVVLAAVFIQSLVSLNYFGVFLSLALAYWIFQQPLNLYIINPWLLILAAVLISIGFQIIFHKQSKCHYIKRHHGEDCRSSVTADDVDGNTPFVNVSFGAASKYLHADALKSGQFNCKCGALEVYFDQVQLDPNGAEIFIDCSLGAVNLFFPKYWHVIENLHGSLSGITNKSASNKPGPNAPSIIVSGDVSLGAVEINYVDTERDFTDGNF